MIDATTHNLYEELPSLGVSADVLMPIAGADSRPLRPVIRTVPPGYTATQALCGFYGQPGVRKEELAIVLNSYRVSATNFQTSKPNTRLNIPLINYASDQLAKIDTFRKEKIAFSAMTADGDATQLIESVPTDEAIVGEKWTNQVVRPFHCSKEHEAVLGAVYYTGFQLKKEAIGEGDDSHHNWCCVHPTATATAGSTRVPVDWISNRNDQRRVPPGFSIRRFTGMSDSQGTWTTVIIRRMIKTMR